jgi:3-isopropylmalate/(R)-2-methylmalate dehydratase small subunit
MTEIAPFRSLRSRLVPLLAPDVDTDQIIPAQFVNVAGPRALADALFARQRERDPDCVFHQAQMRGRTIMLVGSNFGCGSSREAAVWALAAWGFRAIIGRSFNATFRGNCLRNGLLPLAAPADLHERLCAAHAGQPDLEVSIDLERECVEAPAAGVKFATDVEPFTRDLLLRGIDELGYLLDRRGAVEAFEQRTGASR